MTGIRMEHVYKQYEGNDFYSVTDFNLDIRDQEFIVFVGPSGCGKSTALRMVAGLEEITKGELYIGDRLMNDVAPKDRNIAMVFQNYALYPHMTVYDNMAFGLKLRKYDKKEIDRRVRDAAETLGLSEYLERKPAALSGGQRQRVALGRAIVRDADVFLMDEPLSNLDAKLRVTMRAEIARLHQSLDTTTIYVTHDQTEAMTMADRIVIMKDGIIQQVGTPLEVYNTPRNKFVAGFIGSPAMNFFDVVLEDGHITDEHGLSLKLPEGHVKKLAAAGYTDGAKLTFGIRPEDLKNEQVVLDAYADNTVEVTVTVSELLGAETMLYVRYGEEDFISRIDAREVYSPGDVLQLAFDLNKGHYFDPETEASILND